ncbi:MAG: hypothetical protein BroJett011_77010 [Chloroflexota bacterium]|nr:MAG: hypothetical protein BroJett011_77010 [Chloroflexota bacterium]
MQCYLLMKRFSFSFIELTLLLWLVLMQQTAQVYAQGSGCPVNPALVSDHQYQIVTALPLLAQAVPETASSEPAETRQMFPNEKFPGFSLRLHIPLKYIPNPNRRVILSSTPDGNGPTCTDDKVRIESSTGWIFEHDFRSSDRTRIVPLEPVDVTDLLTETDELWIELDLIDLTGPRFSSSPYFLVIVENSPGIPLLPPAHIFKQIPLQITATFTPTSQPAVPPTVASNSISTPTPTPTLIPPVTATPAITVLVSLPSPEPGVWPLPLPLFLGLVLLIVAVILILIIIRRPKLTGVFEITKDGEPWKTVDLSAYGQATTIGPKGRIGLEDDEDNPTLPDIVARLIAERGPDGSMQLIWEPVEQDGHLVASVYQLRHGSEEMIGPYRFVYQNFSEIEPIEELLAGGILNEI